jgi:hypothetical protein
MQKYAQKAKKIRKHTQKDAQNWQIYAPKKIACGAAGLFGRLR